jgi:Metallo-peptidase family M12B Reprolysin-like
MMRSERCLVCAGLAMVLIAPLAAGVQSPATVPPVQLDTDWTSQPSPDGYRWRVTLGEASMTATLRSVQTCPGITQYDVRYGDNVWGRVVVTGSGVSVFIEDDVSHRVWFLRSASTDAKKRLEIDDASQRRAPVGLLCRMAPGGLAFSPPPILTGSATQSWPGDRQTFRMSITMSPLLKQQPNIEDALITLSAQASAVFERYAGISICGVLANGVVDLSPEMSIEAKASRTQEWFAANAPANSYDLGVAFDLGSGSEAVRGSACDPKTSASTVVARNNDGWDLWRLVHEVAHQFGATHTFEEPATDRVDETATEALRGHSGLASPLLLDGHWFHPVTLAQILDGRRKIAKQGRCTQAAQTTAAAPPSIRPADIVVPARTPFKATLNAGTGAPGKWLVAIDDMTIDPQPGAPPYFRSWPATTDLSREFSGVLDPPPATVARLLLLARDATAGTAMAVESVRVVSKTPFAVTTPSGWSAGRENEVHWKPGDTEGPPLNAKNVNILVFDGRSWKLAAHNLKNDGTAKICLLASESGDRVRVRIEPVEAAFFAESRPFAVAPASGGPACSR